MSFTSLSHPIIKLSIDVQMIHPRHSWIRQTMPDSIQISSDIGKTVAICTTVSRYEEGGGVGVAAAGRYYRWGRLRLPPQVATLSTRSVLPRPRAHTRPRPAATVRPLHPTPSNRLNSVLIDTLCSTYIYFFRCCHSRFVCRTCCYTVRTSFSIFVPTQVCLPPVNIRFNFLSIGITASIELFRLGIGSNFPPFI